ncbi:unnamed protein product [Miscanthus lutarioriparius]|uniref:Uncharacterized protein n=1 Tax=Miscanthus lutarioriparius TaxID=422564 RepID=A0A811RAX8_9POAL|nr:unnamed protein product [Miscanthus lutarioriparius]
MELRKKRRHHGGAELRASWHPYFSQRMWRVFDFVMKESRERTSDIANAMRGSLAVVDATFLRASKRKKGKAVSVTCCVLGFVVYIVQFVAISEFVLYPVAVLYCYGPGISLWLSMWRLLSVDDYDSIPDDKKKVPMNLSSALTVLYSLGVAQGVVFVYGDLWNRLARTGLAKEVAGDSSLDTQLVSEYLEDTVTECRKDPSFARRRNFVTYAVNLLLMEPTSTSTSTSSTSSSSKYLSGLTILGSILHLQRDDDDTDTTRPWLHGQATMTKQLLTASASFGQVTHRLLETLGPASPYSGAVRHRAARVLEEVAGSVRLEEFPGATRCISSSLLGTFEEHCWRPEGYERDRDLPEVYERDWLLKEQERRYILEVVRRSRTPSPSLLRRLLKPCRRVAGANGDGSVALAPPRPAESDGEKSRSLVRGYVGLSVSGLRVLQALAASEDNCRFISSTRDGGGGGGGGEVSRIMRPLASDGFHRDHHDECCMIAEESLKLLSRLTAAPGETGEALRAQIAGDTAGAVAALETVLGCPRCQVALKRQAVEVLLGLPMAGTSSIVVSRGSSTSGSGNTAIIFMGILLHIFLLPDKHFGGMSGPTHVLKKRSCTRRLAGEKLLAMVSALQQPSEDHGGGATATATTTSMLQAAGAALGNLAGTVVGAGNDASWRIHATRVLQDLCQDYTKDDEYLKEIKKAMCLAMPEVIKQLLDGCVSTTQAVTVTEAKKIVHCQAPAAGTDLEQGVISDDTIGEETNASHHRQQAKDDDEQPAEGMELYQALVSLCHGIPNSWIEIDKDLAGELNGIAAEICAKEGMPLGTFISLRTELKRRYCWEEKNARVRAN